jgi:hypothetical protein
MERWGSGPKLLYIIGMAVIIVANIASGFCETRIPFDICRALAGLGAALSRNCRPLDLMSLSLTQF